MLRPASYVRRPRWLLAGAVLMLHAIVVVEWTRMALRPREATSNAAMVHLRLLPPPVEEEKPRSEPLQPRVDRMPAHVADRARLPVRPAAAGIPAPAATSDTDVAVAATAASAPLPASAPIPLLDTDATRRAIRQAAHALGIAGRAYADVDAGVPTDSARLSTGVQGAAKGDCMKGEYAGGGMGLLSVPFLAAAVVRGQCAQ